MIVKATRKALYVITSNYVMVALFVFIILMQYHTVSFSPRSPIRVDMMSYSRGNNIWDAWCVYNFRDGSNSKKYLLTYNANEPGYLQLDKKAIAMCN